VAEELNLSNLKPAAPRRDRKRVGRGMGSGKGRYAGRGIKGQKARAGSHKMRPGFEGGQMPVYMRLGKQRGPHSKDAMPIGPFRTFAHAVNVGQLERFEDGADVTPEALFSARVVRKKNVFVKILGEGELSKKLTVTAHRFSASAREKIEQAGGTVVVLEEKPAKPRGVKKKARETDATAAAETQAGAKGEERADAAVDPQPTDREAVGESVASAEAGPAETGGEAEVSAGDEGSEGNV
jgi:large subunit ribosomal protein L15